MRVSHGGMPYRAVPKAFHRAYHGPMKRISFIHRRSAAIAPVNDRNKFNDPHALLKKALERWENEGGRVPELPSSSGRDLSGRFGEP